MKKVGILFVLCFHILTIVGQLPGCNESMPASGPEIPVKIFYESEKNSENHPFLYDDWRQGSIVLINGYLAENVNLKYNANTDDLIYHNERLNFAVIVEKEYIQEFTLTNPAIGKKNNFRRLGIKNIYFADSTGCFAEVLEKGKYSLFCVRVKQKTRSSQSFQATVQNIIISH